MSINDRGLITACRRLGESAAQEGWEVFIQEVVSSGRKLLDVESCSLFQRITEPETGQTLFQLIASDSELLGKEFRKVVFPVGDQLGPGLTAYLCDLFMRGVEHPSKRLNGDELTKHPNNGSRGADFLKGNQARALLTVPLRGVRQQLLGILKMHNPGGSKTSDVFTPDHVAQAEAFGSIVSAFFEQQSVEYITLVKAINETVGGANRDLASTRPLLAELAARIKADRVTVWQVKEDHQPQKIVWFSGPCKDPESTRSVGELLRWRDLGYAEVSDQDCSELAIHVGGFEGSRTVLQVEAFKAPPFTRRDRELAMQVATALGNLRRQIWPDQDRSPDTATGHDHTLRVTESLLKAGGIYADILGVALFVPDHSNAVLRCVDVHSNKRPTDLKTFKYSFNEKAVVSWAWRERKSYFTSDWKNDPEANRAGAERLGVEGNVMGIPIHPAQGPLPQSGKPEGDPLGVLLVWGPHLSVEDQPKFEVFAEFASHALSKTIWLRGIQSAFEEMTSTLAAQTSTRETFAELRSRVLNIIAQVGFRRVRYFRYDPFGNRFVGEESLGMKDPKGFRGLEIHVAQSPYAAQIIREASIDVRARVFDPGATGLGPDPDAGRLEKEQHTPWVVVPLVFEGRVFGQIAADAGADAQGSPEEIVERLNQLEEYLTILGSFSSWLLGNSLAQVRASREDQFLRKALDCLRTPVHSIMGTSDLLSRGAALSPTELLSWTKLLNVQTDRLNEFVKAIELTLVEWTQEISGKPPMEKADLKEVVHRSREALRNTPGTPGLKRVHLEMAPPPEIACVVTANSKDLETCLSEVLHNAWRFSEHGQVIEIRLIVEAKWYRIIVRDEGPGVPESERERIFEPFVSIPRFVGRRPSGKGEFPHPSELEGTGLGLYVARKIARRYGGELICKEAKGGAGAEFVLEIPRAID